MDVPTQWVSELLSVDSLPPTRLLFQPTAAYQPYTPAGGVEQLMGIEPTHSAWRADTLPLHHSCIWSRHTESNGPPSSAVPDVPPRPGARWGVLQDPVIDGLSLQSRYPDIGGFLHRVSSGLSQQFRPATTHLQLYSPLQPFPRNPMATFPLTEAEGQPAWPSTVFSLLTTENPAKKSIAAWTIFKFHLETR